MATLEFSAKQVNQARENLSRVRFVGGPWHNRIVPVVPLSKISAGYMDIDARHLKLAIYRLCYFESDRGTRYAQYVFEELLGGNLAEEPDKLVRISHAN